MDKNKNVFNLNFCESMKNLLNEEKMSSSMLEVINLHTRVETELNISASGLSRPGTAPLQKCCVFTSRVMSACFNTLFRQFRSARVFET